MYTETSGVRQYSGWQRCAMYTENKTNFKRFRLFIQNFDDNNYYDKNKFGLMQKKNLKKKIRCDTYWVWHQKN